MQKSGIERRPSISMMPAPHNQVRFILIDATRTMLTTLLVSDVDGYRIRDDLQDILRRFNQPHS